MYIPVETTDSIAIHSNITLSSDFIKFANSKALIISFFDEYGNYIGGFFPEKQKRSVKCTLMQSIIYMDTEKRLSLAKKIIIAGTHNILSNVRYYNRRITNDTLKKQSFKISEYMKKMKNASNISELMLNEARMREEYFLCFDIIIQDINFKFEKRSRRPPRNEVNSMISFGNVLLYNHISEEIRKTALDIRISFLHSANRRNESLNLDIAEIFKPIIVDRVIFSLINKHMIHTDSHFYVTDTGGVFLNKPGKRIFLNAFEEKLHQYITIGDRKITYKKLIQDEIHKILIHITDNVKYIAYKY